MLSEDAAPGAQAFHVAHAARSAIAAPAASSATSPAPTRRRTYGPSGTAPPRTFPLTTFRYTAEPLSAGASTP